MCLYVSLSLFVCDFGETVIHVTNMIKSEFAIYHWQCAYGGSYCDFSSSNKFMYSDAIITRKNLPTHSFLEVIRCASCSWQVLYTTAILEWNRVVKVILSKSIKHDNFLKCERFKSVQRFDYLMCICYYIFISWTISGWLKCQEIPLWRLKTGVLMGIHRSLVMRTFDEQSRCRWFESSS